MTRDDRDRPRAQAAQQRRRSASSLRRILVLLAALTVVAAACGDADDGSGGAGGGTDDTSASPTQPAEGEGEDTGSGGEATTDTIRIGVATLQEQFPDPHLVVGGNLFPLLWAISENLYRQDLDAELVPALATSYELSDDDLTWTFTLREGVMMHDGSEFTARDVKTAVDRVLGSDDFAHSAAFRQYVTAAEVIDDYTVRVTTNQPYASLLLDFPVPIPTDYYTEVGEQGFRTAPMAAGPFKFVSQELNSSVSYERFDDFWDEERKPNFRNLVYEILPDESSRVAGIQTGTLDVVTGLTALAAEQLRSQEGVRIVEAEATAQADAFVIDNRFPDEPSPLQDVRVRRALLMAIDRDSIAQSLYRGFAQVPDGGLSPITLGYDDSQEPQPFDPDRARELLAEAGASDLSVTLNSYSATATVPDIGKLVEAVAGYWQQIGVNVNLNVVDANSYLPEYRARNLRGIGVLSSPAQFFVEPGRYNTFYTCEGAYSSLCDPEVEALFDEINSKVDIDERAELGRRLSDLLRENLYALPLVRVSTLHAIGPDVEGWDIMKGNPYAGPLWYLRAR